MQEIKTFKSTYNKIIENISLYAENLIENKVIVFKDVNFSIRMQKNISLSFNRYLKYFPVNYDQFHILYKESHNHAINIKNNNKDSILIDWHLEHPGSINPQTMALWNMRVFKCDKECGNTGFVDAQRVLKKLSDEELSFLKKCRVVQMVSNKENTGYWIDEKGVKNNFIPYDAIASHPFSKKETLRIDVLNRHELHSYDFKKPDLDSKLFFESIYKKINFEVIENEENQIWWQWSRNDLLVVDLFSMYHAVKGGFKKGERVFIGFWSFAK